jgi:hypothetical protein
VEGDPNRRRFKQKSFLDFAQAQRDALVGELLGMFAVWKAKGMPLAAVEHRFQAWAEVVGGVLEANGYEGFLSHMDSEIDDQDADLCDFKQLAAMCQADTPYTASALLTRGKGKSLFKDLCDKSSGTGQTVAFGKLLSRFINDDFVASGKESSFVRSQDLKSNSAAYTFTSRKSGGSHETSDSNLRDINDFKNRGLNKSAGDPEIFLEKSFLGENQSLLVATKEIDIPG